MGNREHQLSGDHSDTKEFLKKWGKVFGVVAIGLLGLAIIL